MIDALNAEVSSKMDRASEALRHEMARIRVGKATPGLLDGIKVDYFGSILPINQLANITTPELRLIVIQPWDKNAAPEITKAIQKSDLGLNPNFDGTLIRIPIPPLTEERRKDLVKITRKLAEEGRVSLRNIRRDAIAKLKAAEKNHEISEDDSYRAAEKIQEMTDNSITQMDSILEAKEKEIMEV
ncbi:ribosome recycling factor [candidate division KSB1 bacterium]